MDRDENGIAERQEKLVQQRMSPMLTTYCQPEKSYHTQNNATKAFGAVHSSVYTRVSERCGQTEAAPDRGLGWLRAADCCR